MQEEPVEFARGVSRSFRAQIAKKISSAAKSSLDAAFVPLTSHFLCKKREHIKAAEITMKKEPNRIGFHSFLFLRGFMSAYILCGDLYETIL